MLVSLPLVSQFPVLVVESYLQHKCEGGISLLIKKLVYFLQNVKLL